MYVLRHRLIVMVSGEEIVLAQRWLRVILSLDWRIGKRRFWLVKLVNEVDAMLMKVILGVNLLGQCADRLLSLLRMRRIESLIIDVVEVGLLVLTIHS